MTLTRLDNIVNLLPDGLDILLFLLHMVVKEIEGMPRNPYHLTQKQRARPAYYYLLLPSHY